MALLRIEMDRGRGWETRSEGEFDGELDDIIRALPSYAIQYPHRAFLDGKLVATEVPKGHRVLDRPGSVIAGHHQP
jgi:hypothetical protein